MNPPERSIKKYPNRRLYDTERSCYITLADIRDLVLQTIPFKIIDSQSGEDLTRTVLLQIIMEQENGGEPLFTTEILARMIRYYGNSMQTAFSAYLENAISLFAEQQNQLQQQMSGVLPVNPMEAMTEIMHKNLELWRDMQANLLRPEASGTASDKQENSASDS